MLRRAAVVVALLLAVAAVRVVWVKYRGSDATDFWLFWAVAQSDLKDPYAPGAGRPLKAAAGKPEATAGQRVAASRSSLDITATPFLYTVFRVLGTGDYELDYALFRIFSLAATCIGVLLLAVSAGFPDWAALLILTAVIGLFPSFTSDVQVGNVNQLQLGGLGILVALMKAPEHRASAALTGVVSALLVLFKPNLLPIEILLLAAWAGRDRYDFLARHCAAALLAAVIAVVVSSALFGNPKLWLCWGAAAARLGNRATLPLAYGNLSLAHALHAPPMLGTAIGAALTCGTAALLFRARRDDPFLACAAGVSIPLLTAPLAWQHYFVLLVPGLIGCAKRTPWLGVIAAAPLFLGWIFTGASALWLAACGATACLALLAWTWSGLLRERPISVPQPTIAVQ